MKERSYLWQAAGFAAVTFGGTILHFLYDWTGGSILVTAFSGVNESTWEHMKLMYWPLFGFALIQRIWFRDQKRYWSIKLTQILLGVLLIPVLFYTYNGVFGKSPDWVNIGIFYVCAAAVFLYEWWAFRKAENPGRDPRVVLGSICLVGALFVLFSFHPPRIPLFLDPVTGNYGIPAEDLG